MRRLVLGVLVLAVFTAGVIATFPTESLVALVLSRLPPATAAAVERVGSSCVGMRGLTLEDVTLRPRAGAPALDVRTLSLRPSLLGLLMGRRGRPWQMRAAACEGSASAEVDRQPNVDTVIVHFQALELASCLAPFEASGPLEGTATGEATLTVTPAATTGRGAVVLAKAQWQPSGVPRHFPLRAEEATLRWTFAAHALHVEEFAMTNEEFTASATGVVHFPRPPGAPELDLRIHLQPTAAMPQAHRDLLRKLPGSPPDVAGGRTYHIGGPLDAPHLGMP